MIASFPNIYIFMINVVRVLMTFIVFKEPICGLWNLYIVVHYFVCVFSTVYFFHFCGLTYSHLWWMWRLFPSLFLISLFNAINYFQVICEHGVGNLLRAGLCDHRHPMPQFICWSFYQQCDWLYLGIGPLER